MNNPLLDDWFFTIASNQWSAAKEPLIAFLRSPPSEEWLQKTDVDGNNALYHLLAQCSNLQTFHAALPLLSLLVEKAALSPWDRNVQGTHAYAELMRSDAPSEVLMWCWTLPCEPGHAETELRLRVNADRLLHILQRCPFPGSSAQTCAREKWGLRLDQHWSDGSSTLRRILEASPFPYGVPSPGVLFQGIVALMKEARPSPFFLDEVALLGFWWSHAYAVAPPGSLEEPFKEWLKDLGSKTHGAGWELLDHPHWAWDNWRDWFSEQAGSSTWAGHAVLSACFSASALADGGEPDSAEKRLLDTVAQASFLWEGSTHNDRWPLQAWEKAWALWSVWDRLHRSSSVLDSRIWFLALPLFNHEDMVAWLLSRGQMPTFPATLPEGWEERWGELQALPLGR